jgi:hypothetical protein
MFSSLYFCVSCFIARYHEETNMTLHARSFDHEEKLQVKNYSWYKFNQSDNSWQIRSWEILSDFNILIASYSKCWTSIIKFVINVFHFNRFSEILGLTSCLSICLNMYMWELMKGHKFLRILRRELMFSVWAS